MVIGYSNELVLFRVTRFTWITFWKHKIHSVIEGESNSIKYEHNQHNLMQQGAWLSWELSLK